MPFGARRRRRAGLGRKIYRAIDISDPGNPREVGRFSLPEQADGAATGG